MCIQACPFGAMGYDEEQGIAEKCDLCAGDPECVKHCFYGALEFKQPPTVSSYRSRIFAEKLKSSFSEEVAL